VIFTFLVQFFIFYRPSFYEINLTKFCYIQSFSEIPNVFVRLCVWCVKSKIEKRVLIISNYWKLCKLDMVLDKSASVLYNIFKKAKCIIISVYQFCVLYKNIWLCYRQKPLKANFNWSLTLLMHLKTNNYLLS
jgi:hypothetical protein